MSDNFENTDEFEQSDMPQEEYTSNEESYDVFAQSENAEPFEQSEISEPETFERTEAYEQPEPEQTNYYNSNVSGAYGNQGGYNNTSYNYSNPGGYSNQNGSYNNNGQNEPFRPYDFGASNNYNAPMNSYPPQNGKKKSSKGKKVAAVIIVLAVVIGLFYAVKSLFPENSSTTQIQTTITSPTQASQDESAGAASETATEQFQFATTQSSKTQELSAVDVAEKARPSVVGVLTYKNGQLSGEGSGVSMGLDSTGKYTYIITCAHVINQSGATFGVRTLEGKNYKAEMVATDTRTDIGVLKVEATDIPIAEFGDSTSLRVGETVYAIGNPGGSEYFGSMTNGIISAIDRSVTGTYTMTCVQHNAAINPGNSGGALVNSAGQVIGINSSKIAATDYEGMGFAIPMATVKSVVDNLIKYKYVPNRPKLGIEYASVDSYQLYSMVVAIKGLPAGSLVIAGISSDSTLAGTKAQVGDLIIAVNGKKMDTSDVLLDLINTGSVGDSITLTLCRVESRTYQTSTFDVKITLVEDKGTTEETTTAPANNGGYYHGGASSFEDFFEEYFGDFGF